MHDYKYYPNHNICSKYINDANMLVMEISLKSFGALN